jgi:hypothetical protein
MVLPRRHDRPQMPDPGSLTQASPWARQNPEPSGIRGRPSSVVRGRDGMPFGSSRFRPTPVVLAQRSGAAAVTSRPDSVGVRVIAVGFAEAPGRRRLIPAR